MAGSRHYRNIVMRRHNVGWQDDPLLCCRKSRGYADRKQEGRGQKTFHGGNLYLRKYAGRTKYSRPMPFAQLASLL
jgi:hypothetical protein